MENRVLGRMEYGGGGWVIGGYIRWIMGGEMMVVIIKITIGFILQ